MNIALKNSLNQTKRDALVGYYLQHVIPGRGLGNIAARIKTSDDLYEYLLLDPQVSGQVTTSRIAEAIASVQLYIHRCREQLEPGISQPDMAEASRPGRYLDQWDAYNKRYATWAGLQRLLHYPASYLDPELRYRKTTLFKNLEQTINQGRVTEERVEQAMRDYVGQLRGVLDIRSINAYQVEPQIDDSPVYFVGRSLGDIGTYYWRYVDNSGWGNNGRVRNPLAWSEWREIEAPIEPEGDPAIVYFNKRVHVLCLHKKTSGVTGIASTLASTVTADARNDYPLYQPDPTFSWDLQFATLLADGSWRLRNFPLETLISPSILHSPTRVFAAELRETDAMAEPTLGVFFVQGVGSGEGERRYLCRLSKLLQHLDTPGDGWEFEFCFQDEVAQLYRSIRAYQPLKYGITAPEYSVSTDPNQTFKNNYRGGFELKNIILTNHNNDNIRVTVDVKNTITPEFPADLLIQVGAVSSGLAHWGALHTTTSNNIWHTFTSDIPTSYTEFAKHQYNYLVIGGKKQWIVQTEYIYPPLIWKVGEKKTKLLNFNSSLHDHIFIPTAFITHGQSQIFHPRRSWTNYGQEHVLTTLAGSLLEQKMLEGTDVLLSWGTQTINVDPGGSDWGGTIINSPIRFEGGIGQYTWELFFHVPFLIANRLLAEQRFDEAEHWFKRIFNPAGYRKPDGSLDMIGTTPRYWNVRPLQEDTAWNPSSPENTDDPDLIAAADPMHYKLAVYLRWLELLLARGDHLYRQQNRDSLTEAKMWYVQALQLLGPRPKIPLLLNWADPTLGEASVDNSISLKLLENLFGANPTALAPGLAGQIQVENGPFKAPFNDAVLDYWRRVEQRLFNLRNNLSIDGQPLILPLFESPVSPTALQQARQAGDGSDPAPSMAGLGLWSQRFPLLLERARTAVQQVIQFGANLQGILERRDADALGVLQQTQQGALLGMAMQVHQANIKSLEHNHASLEASRMGIMQRWLHYENLYNRHITDNEQRAMDLRASANKKEITAGVLNKVGAVMDLLPNRFTFGMSCGLGFGELGSLAHAAAFKLEMDARSHNGDANKLESSEQYERRREEWQAIRDQSVQDIAQLDKQLLSALEQISMARKQVAQTELEQAYSQVVLDQLRTRFNSQTLFNWQAGRLAALYYQLYDLTVGLCARAQRSYQWETGDTTAYLRPGNWSDTYQGLLAGESLALSLQRLENKYLDWDRRTLDVHRTVSLQHLSNQTLSKVVQDLLNDVTPPTKPDVIEASLEGSLLAIRFNLDAMQIVDDYPSALNLGTSRLIKTLSVSLPAVLGPYQDVQAVLQYASAHPLADGCKAVALSHGLDDNGQFQLDFNDGKYFPFEGIPITEGVFVLSFPNATSRQRELLLSLTDVILHVRYTIRQGITTGAG